MEFEMPELQRAIWTWFFSRTTCLFQPMGCVYSCSELTDIKMYRLICHQEVLNIRRYSVDMEPILKFVPKLLKATYTFIVSFRFSVSPPTLNNLSPIWKIFVEFDIGLDLENLSKEFISHWNLKRNIGALHEDLCTLLFISIWILFLIRSFGTICRENTKKKLY